MLYLYYSQKAERQFGSKVAFVPDQPKGERQIIYTYETPDPDEVYPPDDKKLVWQGQEKDLRFITNRSPTSPSSKKPPSFRR